jgi:5'-3' exoribonuclease 1
MGIPKYFRYISLQYKENQGNQGNQGNQSNTEKDIINNLDDSYVGKFDNLYLDLNCLIHPVLRKIKFISDTQFFDEGAKNILTEIGNIITLIKPKTNVFIAIDGVAPRAKMEQQRRRRYKSQFEKWLSEPIYKKYNLTAPKQWDTNAISPGTDFMDKLDDYLTSHIGYLKNMTTANIIFSGSREVGEGEHKIMKYIRDVKNQSKLYSHLVYGLDADLIMLSMLFPEDVKISLLREAVHLGKVIPDKYIIFDTNEFKNAVYNDIMNRYKQFKEKDGNLETEENIINDPNDNNEKTVFVPEKKYIIQDYVVLCFIFGNDFIPHCYWLTLDENGMNTVLDLYCQILSQISHYLFKTKYKDNSNKENRNTDNTDNTGTDTGVDNTGIHNTDNIENIEINQDEQDAEYELNFKFLTLMINWFYFNEKNLIHQKTRKIGRTYEIKTKNEGNTLEGDLEKYIEYYPLIKNQNQNQNHNQNQNQNQNNNFHNHNNLNQKNSTYMSNNTNIINRGSSYWSENYYLYTYFKIESTYKNHHFINFICKKYLDMICWNALYYIKGVPDWNEYYPWNAPPLLKHLSSFLSKRQYMPQYKFDDKPNYSSLFQLIAILPPSSHHLINFNKNNNSNTNNKNKNSNTNKNNNEDVNKNKKLYEILKRNGYYVENNNLKMDTFQKIRLYECDPLLRCLEVCL